MKKPRAGEKMDVLEVRSVLYDAMAETEYWKTHHIVAWQRTKEGHQEPCSTCDRYKAEMDGVRRALRKFGAMPRR